MKPKINLNRPSVSTEEILAGKNFNQLMGNYKLLAKPFYKSAWFISTAVATVATVAVVVTLNLTSENPPANENAVVATETEDSVKRTTAIVKYDEDSPCINAPVKGAEKPYSVYTSDADKEIKFTHFTGTEVKIPAGAMTDEAGKTVNGKVEIKYREFHDVVDIFLSGIPMTYDSAGIQSHFQSAGMIEILAYQNGKPLQLKPEKPIEIKLASLQPGTEFNVYALDTASKNWVFKGKDVVTNAGTNAKPVMNDTSALLALHRKKDVELGKIKSEIQKVEKEIRTLSAEKPVEPKKVNYGKYNFDIDVDKNEFPELALFENTRFEVGPESSRDFTSDYYKTEWEDAQLKPNKKNVNYLLTLKKGDLKKTVIVYPVYDEANYPDAKANFDEKMKGYSAKLEEKEKRKNELTEEENATRLRWEKEIISNRHKMMSELEMERQQREVNNKTALYASVGNNLGDYAANFTQYRVLDANTAVTRTFQADGFGVFNCDNPKQLPKGERVIASFSNKFTNVFCNPNFVYLMERNTNSVFTYTPATYGSFKFDPDHENFIITTLNDGRVAVFSSKSFSEMPKRMREYNFQLHVFNEIPRTEQKVREMLGIST